MLFFFNATATTEIYTLSLHDALPICVGGHAAQQAVLPDHAGRRADEHLARPRDEHHLGLEQPHDRSEEHTSELQSHSDLVCRLLLEKKKKKNKKQKNNRQKK